MASNKRESVTKDNRTEAMPDILFLQEANVGSLGLRFQSESNSAGVNYLMNGTNPLESRRGRLGVAILLGDITPNLLLVISLHLRGPKATWQFAGSFQLPGY